MTNNQETILHIFHSLQRHLTAEDIYAYCRQHEVKMSLATIYRNLGAMVELGMLTRIPISGQPEHYDCNVVSHEHVYCSCCGSIMDVDVGDLKAYLEERTGVKLESYELCMRYVCPDCQTKRMNTEQ